MQKQKIEKIETNYTGQTLQDIEATSDSSQLGQPQSKYHFISDPPFFVTTPSALSEEDTKEPDEEILKAVEKNNYGAVLSPVQA